MCWVEKWSTDGINELVDEVREPSENNLVRKVSINFMSHIIREKLKDGNI